MCILVTPQLVADVLRVPRIEFLDYLNCDHLRTVSKDELMAAFCEFPSDWGDRPSYSASSRSAPFSSSGDVTLGDIMVQLQRMDARLDTLSTELYQVNVRVDRIARRQVTMGGFAPEATLSPPPSMASDSEDENDDDGDDNDASDDDDGDASSTDEMST